MKARATILSTMLAVLAAIVPQARAQFPEGAGPPPGYYGGGGYPPMQGAYPPPGYAPGGHAPPGGYPPGGYAPPGGFAPGGYGPSMPAAYGHGAPPMQSPYADAGYYQPQGEPQYLPGGQAQGYPPDYQMSGDMYGGGPYGEMGETGAEYCPPGSQNYEVCKYRVWANTEALLWTRHERVLPPLITTAPTMTPRNGGPVPPIAAVIGNPETTLLFGGGREGRDATWGGAINFGMWLDPANEVGVGGRFWMLDDDEQDVHVEGLPIIGVPFFNTTIGFEDALLVSYDNAAFPPTTVGSVDVRMSNEIHGAEAYGRFNMLHWLGTPRGSRFADCPPGEGKFRSIDILAGYQYSRVNDLLQVLTRFDSSIPSSHTTTDYFRTKNQFHGGLLGLSGEVRNGRWSLKGLGKIGFGNMHQTVLISGNNTIDVGGGPIQTIGGLFTQSTNIGTFRRDHFAYIPEAQINLGYQMNNVFRLTMGYDFIYWSNVVLAGEQVDRNINTLLFGGMAGAPPPQFTWNDADFWAMGLNFGLIGEY